MELHPNNINRENGFFLSRFWKPLILFLKDMKKKVLSKDKEGQISHFPPPVCRGPETAIFSHKLTSPPVMKIDAVALKRVILSHNSIPLLWQKRMLWLWKREFFCQHINPNKFLTLCISTPKMEAACSSEMSGFTYKNAQCCNPDNHKLNNYHCDNLIFVTVPFLSS